MASAGARRRPLLLVPLALLLLLVSASSAVASSHSSFIRGPTRILSTTSEGANGTNTTAPASAPVPAPAPAPASDPNFGNPVSVQWYQAHGWLMWTAFGLLMPAGIIISRHMQPVTPHWFYAHVTLMTLGVACMVGGAVIAFSLFQAIPGTPADDPAALHIRIGTAVFIMACLNFLFGLFRPHKAPGNKPRILWYWLHFTFGTVVVLLSWYVIYTGMNIFEANWVFVSGSSLSDLRLLKDLFAVNIAIMAYVYLLLGRWDYMMGQADAEPEVDGVTRLLSSSGVSKRSSMKSIEEPHGGA